MDEMSLVTIHPKRIRWKKNPWNVVSGFKHDNRLKCHRGIVSQWTFQVGLNVTVDETWVDVTSRHPLKLPTNVCQTSQTVKKQGSLEQMYVAPRELNIRL